MISDEKLKEFKVKLNKKVYFDFRDNCRIGKLIGIMLIGDNPFYCIKYKDSIIYVDINKQIKLL